MQENDLKVNFKESNKKKEIQNCAKAICACAHILIQTSYPEDMFGIITATQ